MKPILDSHISYSILFCVFFIFSANNSFAVTVSEQKRQVKQTEKELSQLKQKIQQVKSSLGKINRSKNKHLFELKQVALKINASAKSLFSLSQKIKQLEKQSSDLNKAVHQQKLNLSQHQSILSHQLMASFQTGQQEFIKLLLNQQEPAKFNRIMTYYEYFNKARLKQIEQVNLIVKDLDEKRAKIHLMRQEIALQKHLKEEERLVLERDKQKQNNLINRLAQKQKKTSSELNQLIKNKNRLNNLLNQIQQAISQMAKLKQKKPFRKLKGKLKWPTRGKINKLFGHWRSIDKVKWNGHIIKNAEGSKVYSIAYGRVVFSDWFRGYGLLTIIDHGKKYMSLYGHSQSLLKSVGDIVYAGDQIASSGRSGGRKKSGTYFEIRYKGQPVNPSRWCSRMPR